MLGKTELKDTKIKLQQSTVSMYLEIVFLFILDMLPHVVNKVSGSGRSSQIIFGLKFAILNYKNNQIQAKVCHSEFAHLPSQHMESNISIVILALVWFLPTPEKKFWLFSCQIFLFVH